MNTMIVMENEREAENVTTVMAFAKGDGSVARGGSGVASDDDGVRNRSRRRSRATTMDFCSAVRCNACSLFRVFDSSLFTLQKYDLGRTGRIGPQLGCTRLKKFRIYFREKKLVVLQYEAS